MKTLYLECNMGAAGDMLMAALLELLDEKERADFLAQMNAIMPEGVQIGAEPDEKCGVTGTHVHVHIHGEEEDCGDNHHHHNHHSHDHIHTHEHHDHEDYGHTHTHEHHDHEDHSHTHTHEHHDHEAHGHMHTHEHHHHSGLGDIYRLIETMAVSDTVKEDAKAVYRLIAEAESKVHGKTMEQIHFHEVGTLDAVADVVGNCILMEKIGAVRIIVSPVHVGCGSVKCAHGILPVPAPATALILEGIPIYSGQVKGELCTPTGAALLKYFGDCFETMPAMTVRKIGYGMGTKNFEERPNCIRALFGETAECSTDAADTDSIDSVSELAANIDDMTGEELGFAAEKLMKAGALDVYFEQITMKKFRPAVKLCCICREEERKRFAALILKYTSTLGVREYRCSRFIMKRHTERRETPWGEVDVKVSEGYGVKKSKPEFAQLAEIAEREDLSLREAACKVKEKAER